MHYFKHLQNFGRIGPRIVFICFILLMVWIEPCISATYYVDSSNGNDSDDGLTEESALKTLYEVSTRQFLQGDSILLKRSETWNGKLIIKWSGTPANPITIGAYGSGDLPKITNYRIVSSWSGPNNGVYSASTSYTYGLFEDTDLLWKEDEMPNSPGEWWYDAGTLYYYPTSGQAMDHTVKKVNNTQSGISIDNANYIRIENLNIEYSGWGIAVLGKMSHHIWIDSCEIDHCWRHGIDFYKSGGYGSVTNCKMAYFGDSAIYFTEAPGNYYLVAHNTISYCNYEEWDPDRDGHALGMQSVSYCIVRDNIISRTCKAAISIGGGYPTNAEHNVIQGNTISDCDRSYSDKSAGQGFGIHSNTADYQTNYNIIYQNIFDNCKTGFKPQGNNIGNKFFNNTLYACGSSYGYSAALYMKYSANYELINNVFTASVRWHIYQESSVTSGNSFNYNLYYTDLSNGWRYRGSTKADFAQWRSSSGQDTHSLEGDPRLTDTANDDFSLQSNSPCIDSGGWLTTITSSTANNQTSLSVNDASYFYDGFNIPRESGSTIKTQNGAAAIVTEVNYATNTLTVSPAINIVNGEGIALDYTGNSPDIGAKEFDAKEFGTISPPTSLSIVR